MKIFGQIENVSFEQLSSDPAANTQGRFWQNTTEDRIKHDNGVTKRALFRNDEKMVVGNDPTPASNVRIHRGTAGLIQDVLGDDVTLDGVAATILAQRSFRDENATSGTLPATGNIGRHLFLTDQKVLAEDDGTNWRRHIPEFVANDPTAGGTVELAAITSSVVRLTGSFTTLAMIPAGFHGQRATLINRTGADVSVSHDSGATPADRIYTGTNANLVFKSNSSLPIYYDSTTQRWQVVGEAAGAASGGGGLPNSSVATITTNYTVLITDDVILADTSLGPFSATLPSPIGNFGKRLLFEKIGTRQNNVLTLVGTINGIVNEDIWALNAPFLIVSDGTAWRSVGSVCGTIFIHSQFTPLAVAATSTANILLETMSAASATNIDNILAKSGNRIVLKNQTAPEENGVYLMPATNITIAATATVNVNIATLANGTVVNAHVCATGEKVSLRFQTVASENGIYVVGASTGLSVRDTSQRDPSYVTPASLKDLMFYSDWYNYPSGAIASSPTEASAAHTNDQKMFKQKNDNLTTFTAASYLTTADVFTIKVPSNASVANYEICPFGGPGAGGTNARGGASGSGALPIFFSRPVTPGSNIIVSAPVGTIPGTGKTGSAGIGQSLSVTQSSPAMAQTISGASGALATGVGVVTVVSLAGGPLFTNGSANNVVGVNTYFAVGGAVGTGGALGGGGGGAGVGIGGQGGTGSAAANFLGGAGVDPTGFKYGAGGGGGGSGPASGRPGRGGFSGSYYVKITWG